MIQPIRRPDTCLIRHERADDGLRLYSEYGALRLTPVAPDILRATFTREAAFQPDDKPGVILHDVCPTWSVRESEGEITLETAAIKARVDKRTLAVSYESADGRPLMRETGRALEGFDHDRLDQNAEATVDVVRTADGEKRVVRAAQKVFDRRLYRARLDVGWQHNEALYGLGQHEEGMLDLRGGTVYLNQANMKVAIPMLVSSLGYGLLMNSYCPMIFCDNAFGSYLYAEADMELDYYFINGGGMDGVIGGYRRLTGKASMLPKWAYGYVQSQERYETQQELLDVAAEYRRRGLGLDCMVLDWCSWPDGMWGEKSLDESRFPDPAALTRALHDMNVRLMVSIWPNMNACTPNHAEFHEKALLLPFSDIYDALDPDARALYWAQARRGLFRYGVDAWWCDSCEPVTPEWNHMEKPAPANQYREFADAAAALMPPDRSNAYALYHAQGMYEGQRGEDESKRVVNLIRSAYTGSQRYGAVVWSGDTSASWETLRKQIPAGLNFCASGLPYWTLDIGAFFVKKGREWYWNGDYEAAAENPSCRELYTRWFQLGCLLPMFRAHGTDMRREMWRIGDDVYDALVKMNRLRYRLMPYLYSLAGAVWKDDRTMMRMLAFDFPNDARALRIGDQFLLGESLMACPVTFAMYYDVDGSELTGVPKRRRVYLPEGAGWYDFWTERFYRGGQTIDADAPLDTLPLYVRAGSIVPMGDARNYAGEADGKPPKLYVYPGADAAYQLYEDAGDGYGYERGEYSVTVFKWHDAQGKLTACRDGKPLDVNDADVVLVGKQ